LEHAQVAQRQVVLRLPGEEELPGQGEELVDAVEPASLDQNGVSRA
jgi:hypothetical protein